MGNKSSKIRPPPVLINNTTNLHIRVKTQDGKLYRIKGDSSIFITIPSSSVLVIEHDVENKESQYNRLPIKDLIIQVKAETHIIKISPFISISPMSYSLVAEQQF